MEKLIHNLYKQVVVTKAGEGHIIFNQIMNDPKAFAVVSVYHNQRPAHEVLDELWFWAENNDLHDIMDKIRELEKLD